MRKLLFAMVVAALALSAGLTASAQGQIPAKLPDLNGRTVTAVSAQDYTPLTFVDESGKGVGLEYEVLTEICTRLNCKYNWKVAAWDGMITAINQKQYDLGFDGISITDERKQQVDFSEPYIVVQQKFLVRADESRFTDGKAFAANTALKIGSQAGTSGYYTASGLLNLKEGETSPRLVVYENFGISVQALLKGDVDAVITDVAAGRGFVGASAGKLKLLDEVLSTDPLGFIFPKGSDLVAPFNAAIASMKADGYLAYAENKWFFLYQPPSQGGAAATPAATAAATQAK
ncbi:MAG: transporter substrate-binding domain-containing protein [Anaerolineae bacterium]|nr:transporter substrate-binding domain-containing protein [Anaerolineae bacterium]